MLSHSIVSMLALGLQMGEFITKWIKLLIRSKFNFKLWRYDSVLSKYVVNFLISVYLFDQGERTATNEYTRHAHRIDQI